MKICLEFFLFLFAVQEANGASPLDLIGGLALSGNGVLVFHANPMCLDADGVSFYLPNEPLVNCSIALQQTDVCSSGYRCERSNLIGWDVCCPVERLTYICPGGLIPNNVQLCENPGLINVCPSGQHCAQSGFPNVWHCCPELIAPVRCPSGFANAGETLKMCEFHIDCPPIEQCVRSSAGTKICCRPGGDHQVQPVPQPIRPGGDHQVQPVPQPVPQETNGFNQDTSQFSASRRATLDRLSPKCPRPDGTFYHPLNIPGPCSKFNRILCPPDSECVRSDLGYHICCPTGEEDPLQISSNLPAIEETNGAPNIPIVEATRASEIPRGGEIRSGSEVSRPSEIPRGSEIRRGSEIPTGGEVPRPSEIPRGSEIRRGSEIPTGGEVRRGTEVPRPSEIPKGRQIQNGGAPIAPIVEASRANGVPNVCPHGKLAYVAPDKNRPRGCHFAAPTCPPDFTCDWAESLRRFICCG